MDLQLLGKVSLVLGSAWLLFGGRRIKRTFDQLPFKHSLMSHRGGSNEHVENTLPGFRASVKMAVDLLELDVHLTKDGHVVIFHDDDLGRMCGAQYKGRKIPEFLLKDLPPLLIPEHLKDNKRVIGDPDSSRIPLLRELLDEFPLYPMQIDVKRGSEQLVIQVGRMIQEKKREHVTVWGSFISKQQSYILKHFGTTIPVFFTILRAAKARVLHSLGLLWTMNIYESAAIIPNVSFLVNRSFIQQLRERGVGVIVFGRNGSLDTEEEWNHVRNQHCSGICSNSPTKLTQWLKENSLF
ncbi:PLC-like phosphodiesterase [Gorgonomyces haynaldii]|nr:PLC-like phosphodiesterase [Gorgonomyces haynaldii]